MPFVRPTPSKPVATAAIEDLQIGADIAPPANTSETPRFRKDRIAYIADLISELEMLSHTAGCTTLAGILRLAQAEAYEQLAVDRLMPDQSAARR